jgi:hypothetical protein
MDLGKRGVHHQDKPYRDRNVCRTDRKVIDKIFHPGNEISQAYSDSHSQEDPEREITVKE